MQLHGMSVRAPVEILLRAGTGHEEERMEQSRVEVFEVGWGHIHIGQRTRAQRTSAQEGDAT